MMSVYGAISEHLQCAVINDLVSMLHNRAVLAQYTYIYQNNNYWHSLCFKLNEILKHDFCPLTKS